MFYVNTTDNVYGRAYLWNESRLRDDADSVDKPTRPFVTFDERLHCLPAYPTKSLVNIVYDYDFLPNRSILTMLSYHLYYMPFGIVTKMIIWE